MDRFTDRNFDFTADFVARHIDSFPIAQCLSKFQEYENAVEDGLLVRLPCKVRDTVYTIANSRIFLKSIEQISINSYGEWCFSKHLHGEWCVSNSTQLIPFSDFGKNVFLTREAAERALEEKAEIEKKEE